MAPSYGPPDSASPAPGPPGFPHLTAHRRRRGGVRSDRVRAHLPPRPRQQRHDLCEVPPRHELLPDQGGHDAPGAARARPDGGDDRGAASRGHPLPDLHHRRLGGGRGRALPRLAPDAPRRAPSPARTPPGPRRARGSSSTSPTPITRTSSRLTCGRFSPATRSTGCSSTSCSSATTPAGATRPWPFAASTGSPRTTRRPPRNSRASRRRNSPRASRASFAVSIPTRRSSTTRPTGRMSTAPGVCAGGCRPAPTWRSSRCPRASGVTSISRGWRGWPRAGACPGWA